jgi:hypothetical protein
VVPMVLDRTKVLMAALVPAESVRVPLMVWSPANTSALTPSLVLPATDRLLKVLDPTSVQDVVVFDS